MKKYLIFALIFVGLWFGMAYAASDKLLMETGDALLLESGDDILLETGEAVSRRHPHMMGGGIF